MNAHHTQTLISNGAVVALRRKRLRLAVTKGVDKKLERDVDWSDGADRIVIGTHERCHLTLTDPAISRHHCEIALVATGYAIRDLSSTNGTFFGDARVGEIIVDRDVRLRLGDTVVRVTPLSDTVDLPLADATRFGPLLGRSPAMRRVFEILGKVAPTEATVLLTGESGTGKEVAARAIHEASPRADAPLVVVDCAALPANLIESELFGHERGAFTGAVRERTGAFELADGGTVFLDELGELPLELQTRLLGVLERRVVRPVGGKATRPVDVRIVAATNRDLRREVNRGAFREDLYFRIAVVTVEMPPLRERPEDIPLLVESFIADSSAAVTIDEEAMEQLRRQPWTGNVRELRNALERAAALGQVDMASTPAGSTLPGVGGDIDPDIPFKVGKAALVEGYELAYVKALMDRHSKNITQAARAAEIDRVYLLRLLDKYGLRPTRRKK